MSNVIYSGIRQRAHPTGEKIKRPAPSFYVKRTNNPPTPRTRKIAEIFDRSVSLK